MKVRGLIGLLLRVSGRVSRTKSRNVETRNEQSVDQQYLRENNRKHPQADHLSNPSHRSDPMGRGEGAFRSFFKVVIRSGYCSSPYHKKSALWLRVSGTVSEIKSRNVEKSVPVSRLAKINQRPLLPLPVQRTLYTVCPRSFDAFHIVTYLIK